MPFTTIAKFERTNRQFASYQCCVASGKLCVAGGQPLNSGVGRNHSPLKSALSILSEQKVREVNYYEKNDANRRALYHCVYLFLLATRRAGVKINSA